MSTHTITRTVIDNPAHATNPRAAMRLTVHTCTCGAPVTASYTFGMDDDVDGKAYRCANGHTN